MIGVMGSAIFPGRIGEPARMLVVTRRLEGPTVRRMLAVVAGTVFSQTLMNLLALAILAAVAFTRRAAAANHLGRRARGGRSCRSLICLLVVFGPACWRRARARVRRA